MRLYRDDGHVILTAVVAKLRRVVTSTDRAELLGEQQRLVSGVPE